MPAFYCQVGQVNGMTITAGRSCCHIASTHIYLVSHNQTSDDDDVEMEDAENTTEDECE